ncbi:MAG: hypothetical protein JNM79_13205 [Burkholderiales bacterium]|nr:hypothetical protein [Burkholderiales bacterium]
MSSVYLVAQLPAGLAPARLDALPALRQAFSGPRLLRAAGGAEAWWLARFGIARQADWPVAPLRVAAPGERYWLCADPVHLHVDGDAVLLDAFAADRLDADGALRMAAALAPHFAAEDIVLAAASPREWVLGFAAPQNVSTHSPCAADGRSIEPFLPAGADAGRLKRLATEAQMLLFAAEDAAPHAAINALWLWGGGVAVDAVAAHPDCHVWSDAAHLRELARLSQARHDTPRLEAITEALRGAGQQTHLIDAGRGPDDPDAWPAWLASHWLAPLRTATRASATALNLVLAGAQRHAEAPLYRFDALAWLRRGSLGTILDAT